MQPLTGEYSAMRAFWTIWLYHSEKSSSRLTVNPSVVFFSAAIAVGLPMLLFKCY